MMQPNQIELKELTLKLAAPNKRILTVAKQVAVVFDVDYKTIYGKVRGYIRRAKDKPIQPAKEEKRVIIQNQEPSSHKSVWDGTKTLKIAIMGDTQMG